MIATTVTVMVTDYGRLQALLQPHLPFTVDDQDHGVKNRSTSGSWCEDRSIQDHGVKNRSISGS